MTGGGYIYILTNRRNGILYVSVTKRSGPPGVRTSIGFCRRLHQTIPIEQVVYFERFDDIRDAIQREHNIKHWSRAWKVRMIVATNPDWNDLFETVTK
jgi:putative endonuclease